jgi:hypothetical protein
VAHLRLLSLTLGGGPLSRSDLAPALATLPGSGSGSGSAPGQDGTDGPDVVCVHGSPTGPRWRSRSGALARQAGLVVVGGGGTAGGNLLLSALAVDVDETEDLVLDAARSRWPAAAQRSLPGPAAVLARLRRGASRFTVAAARLSPNPPAAQAQAARLDQALTKRAADGGPAIVSMAGAHRLDPGAWRVLAHGRITVAPGIVVDESIEVAEVHATPANPPGNSTGTYVRLVLPG